MPHTKPQRVASLSLCGLSDHTPDFTDDVGGITRSSITLESLPLDLSSRTRSTSAALSSVTTSLLAKTPLRASLPERSMRVHVGRGAFPRRTAKENDENEETEMDVFDAALAVDVRERSQRHTRFRDRSQRILSEGLSGVEAMECSALPSLLLAVDRVSISELSGSTAVASRGNMSTRRAAQQRHLEVLIDETRALHAALVKQLKDLCREEAQEQRRRGRHREWASSATAGIGFKAA